MTAEDVTSLIRRWQHGHDPAAEAQLFALVERDLRQMAAYALQSHDRLAHKIEPRELVSEAYLRLRDYDIATSHRGPFFVLIAKVMRHCLIDLARAGAAAKRPNTRLRVVDTGVMHDVAAAPQDDVDLIDYYDALDALGKVSGRQAQAIELKILGLTKSEIAETLGISPATTTRDLKLARAFLAFRLGLTANWVDAEG